MLDSFSTSQWQTQYCVRSITLILKVLIFVLIFALLPQDGNAQVGYKRHMSDLRIQELKSLSLRLERSINMEKYACESYFDYVCSNNDPLFSILGHLPDLPDLIQLLRELQEDPEQFEAKQKMVDFFISCNTLKSVEDCYRECFEYFRPLFGYIISKNHIDSSTHEHGIIMGLLENFVIKAERTDNFLHHPIRLRISALKEKFRVPHIYFRAGDLNQEYRDLRIYRESYDHNLRNLEQYRKRKSIYVTGVQRTMLDWCLYLYQSRNKPMSYYFPTLNVHLWMTLYNSTERYRDVKRFNEIGECLKLPQFVNVLDEARILAVVYLKSFRNAWQDYSDWIISSPIHQEIFDQENEILKQYHLNNKRLFFTLFAQNFCDFGKELAENVFYLGLKQSPDFFSVYSCGYQTERNSDCV